MTARCLPLLLAAVALGCRSVAVPVERYYRLEPPPAAAPDPQRGGVLRVHDLQLATALDAGCLLRLDGVRLEPQPLSRWVAPLDRLVTDAVVLGLSRARVCELVKGSADPGAETWTLRGRIVDFAEVVDGAGTHAAVTLELWLEAGEQLLFHGEFAAREAVAGAADRDAAVVAALSRGIGTVVGGVVERMRGLDLFAAARRDAAAPPVAAPPR
jgi:uncharacterized lipoprotein YmbA